MSSGREIPFVVIIVVTFALFSRFAPSVTPQILDSPCPRLFVYEPSREADRWYGIVTLLTDSELSGVWLRVILDRPAVQLGNWFGEIVTTDNKEFLIRNRNHKLPVNTPYPLRFYVKYDPSEPVPKIAEIRLNARTFCPEGITTTTTTTSGPQLMTSKPLASSTEGVKPQTTSNEIFAPIGIVEETTKGTFFIRPQIFEGAKPDPDVFGLNQTEQEGEECGIIPATAIPIISHGKKTTVGEFPWHVAVYQSFGSGLEYACGGSLVSRYHVVTAGHCVTDSNAKGTPVLEPEQVVVHLGKDNLKEWSSSKYQLREVIIINRHPEYNGRYYSNDVAILKLSSAAKYTDTVRPVCLWEKEEDIDKMAGRVGIIAGFGYDESGSIANQLIKTWMPVVKQTTCIFSFPNFYSRYSSQKTFCAGFKNGTTVCNGDSGGGLVFPKSIGQPAKKIHFLRGIASIILRPSGSDDNRKCNPEHFPIFTDVAKHLGFIRKCMDE